MRKYPRKDSERILRDVVARTPDDEGKWFTAAKRPDSGSWQLSWRRPRHATPRPARAACDFSESNSALALEAGLAALHWLAQGYGYEITGAEVWAAYSNTTSLREALDRFWSDISRRAA